MSNLERMVADATLLSVTVSTAGSITRISVAGELDGSTAGGLTGAVARACGIPAPCGC